MLFLHLSLYFIQHSIADAAVASLSRSLFIIHVLRFACTQWVAIGTDLVVFRFSFFCAVKHIFFLYPTWPGARVCVSVFWFDDSVLSMAMSPVRHKSTCTHTCFEHIGRGEKERQIRGRKNNDRQNEDNLLHLRHTLTNAPNTDRHTEVPEIEEMG